MSELAIKRLIYNDQAFAVQCPDQDGSVHYYRVQRTLDERVLRHHLDGCSTVATYLVGADRQARVAVIDFDTGLGQLQAVLVGQRLRRAGAPSLLEGSRNGRAHLWLLLESPQDALWLRRVCLGLLADVGLDQDVEVFPRSTAAFGSPVRVPLGVHRKGERAEWARHPLLFPDGMPVGAGQPPDVQLQLNLVYLANAGQARPERLAPFVALAPVEPTLDDRRQRGTHGAADEGYYAAIAQRLGVLGYQEDGWSQRFPCVLRQHEHDTEHPAATWHGTKHIYHCHKCQVSLLGDEIAALLDVRREEVA